MNSPSLGRPLVLVLAASSLGLALSAAAQDGAERQSDLAREHYGAVREMYGFATWPQAARRAGLTRDLALPGFVAGELSARAGRLTRTYSLASEDGGEPIPAFVLESTVADSVELAQRTLLDWLAGVQSQRPLPATRELGLAIGDVGFAGPSGAAREALAWIAFVRGNVAVRVSAFDARRTPDLDLAGIALLVDGAVQDAPALAEGAALPCPVIATLAAERETLTAGDRTRLDVVVLDPTGGEPHLVWDLAGEGQGYVERRADGLYLFTTGAGAIELALEATGTRGTVARRTLAVLVTEE